MPNITPLRKTLGGFLGQVLTPEMAAEIELALEHVPDNSIDLAQFGELQHGKYTIKAERFVDIQDELHTLHTLHWCETERARHGLPLNPDYAAMLTAEKAGRLLQFTARVDGILVGNIRFYVYRDMHTQTLAAKEDTFFLRPEHRKGLTAIHFWKFSEQCLSSIGVLEVRTDSKVILNADGKVVRNVGRLNEFIGYEHVSNGYLKTLGKNNGRKRRNG